VKARISLRGSSGNNGVRSGKSDTEVIAVQRGRTEATMAGDLLLVGSIPLDTAEQVFRRVGGSPGKH
jgi:hypothetical protein